MESSTGDGPRFVAPAASPASGVEAQPLQSPARRTAILVTGMHRNGTSALARTLSLLGAALPGDLVEANEGNPTGHWEPRGMVDLNDRMLADAGSDLYSVVDIQPDWFASPAAARFAAEAVALIERSFESEDLVVLKDPRTALLAPIWNDALARAGYRVVHVLPLRHPVDVAESLRRRHLKSFPYDAWVAPRGETVWLRYTLAAVRGSRGHDRVFLHYADLIADWRGAVDRIGRDLGIVWPRRGGSADGEVDAFLHGNERAGGRHPAVPVSSGQWSGLDLVELASACFDTLASRGDDAATLDVIRSEFTTRIAGVGSLVTMFEGLYPLVWHHYEAGRVMRGQLDAALAAEETHRATLQRHWAALTTANDDRRHLQAELGSRDRHAAGLQGSLAGLEGRLALQDEELERLRREIARASDRPSGATPDPTTLEVGRRLVAAEEEIQALRASTSWRVTAPLRALSRAFRGRMS